MERSHEFRNQSIRRKWYMDTFFLPKRKKLNGCMWVYKIKYKYDDSIERYKVGLITKGYTQVEGLDYNETFAPVAKIVTIRCLLAITTTYN